MTFLESVKQQNNLSIWICRTSTCIPGILTCPGEPGLLGAEFRPSSFRARRLIGLQKDSDGSGVPSCPQPTSQWVLVQKLHTRLGREPSRASHGSCFCADGETEAQGRKSTTAGQWQVPRSPTSVLSQHPSEPNGPRVSQFPLPHFILCKP